MAFLQTGAPYKRRGSIPPVYIVFRAACFSPQLSFADFDSAFILRYDSDYRYLLFPCTEFADLSLMNMELVCYL